MGTAYIKNVAPGTHEYMSREEALAPGEETSFEFNDEVTIDDAILEFEGGNEGDLYDLLIRYPASAKEGIIATIIMASTASVAYYLNPTAGEGHTGTGKVWYRVPPRGKVVVRARGTNGSSVVTNMVLIGRAG